MSPRWLDPLGDVVERCEQDGVPVGTVHLGISGPSGATVTTLHLDGDRAAVRRGAVVVPVGHSATGPGCSARACSTVAPPATASACSRLKRPA